MNLIFKVLNIAVRVQCDLLEAQDMQNRFDCSKEM